MIIKSGFKKTVTGKITELYKVDADKKVVAVKLPQSPIAIEDKEIKVESR